MRAKLLLQVTSQWRFKMKVFAFLASMFFVSSVMASPIKFHVDLSTVGPMKGLSVDSETATIWTNKSGSDASLVFDPAAGTVGATVEIPAGATAFVTEFAAGTSKELSFAVTGLYRFAIVFSDGTVKSGELAVTRAEVVTVDIVGIAFSPKIQKIKAGQTVKWVNTTTMVHTVTTDPALAQNPTNAAFPEGATPFHSGNIAPGTAYAMKLTVPGTYKYFCKPHEQMGHLGTIIVE